MKKTNAKKLKALIEHGNWGAMQDKDGNWAVFMYINGANHFDMTLREKSIKDSLYAGLVSFGCSWQEINEEWSNLTVVDRPRNYLKPGDKCQILESARDLPEFDGWGVTKKEMVGKKGLEILAVGDCIYRIGEKKYSDWRDFPHHVVAPYFEEEPTIDATDKELIAEIERRGLVEEGKVLK